MWFWRIIDKILQFQEYVQNWNYGFGINENWYRVCEISQNAVNRAYISETAIGYDSGKTSTEEMNL